MHPSTDNIETVDHFEDALSAVSSDSYTTATQPDNELSGSPPPLERNVTQTTKYSLFSTSNSATNNKRPKCEPALPVSAKSAWNINQVDHNCTLPPSDVTTKPTDSESMVFEPPVTLTTLMDNHQADKSTKDLFVNLLIAADHDAIERVGKLFARHLEMLQGGLAAATAEYAVKHPKSRKDIRRDLIYDEYRKNKTLNKFELATDAKVQARVDSYLDKVWLEHASSLTKLERSIRSNRVDIAHAKNMLDILQSVKSIVKVNKVESGSINAQPHGHSISQDLRSLKPATLSSPVSESTVSISQMLNDHTHNNQPTTPFNKNPVVVLMPPAPEGIEKQNVLPADYGIGLQLRHKLDHRRSDMFEPEDSSIFTSKEAYDHDQKGDKKPVVSLPVSEKKRTTNVKNPFAGLDNYARELYSKSPTPEPSDPSKRILVNIDVMKHALDQKWAMTRDREPI